MSGTFWGEAGQAIVAEPSEIQRKLYDRFVEEYLFDLSPYRAAIRCGFGSGYADQYSKQFMSEPYVQRKIKERELAIAAENSENEQKKLDEQKVLTMLRRMIDHPYPATQVAALGKMIQVLGMAAPIKTEQNVNHRGGVMRVPEIADIGAWEKAATESQLRLVNDTNAGT